MLDNIRASEGEGWNFNWLRNSNFRSACQCIEPSTTSSEHYMKMRISLKCKIVFQISITSKNVKAHPNISNAICQHKLFSKSLNFTIEIKTRLIKILVNTFEAVKLFDENFHSSHDNFIETQNKEQ